MIRPPWWCCFGWSPRSPVCLADNTLHAVFGTLPGPLRRVCDTHDRFLTQDTLSRLEDA